MVIKYILFFFLISCAPQKQENFLDKIVHNSQKEYHFIVNKNKKVNNYQDIEEIKDQNRLKNKIYLEQKDLGMLPYTCSLDRYPAYFILSNRSCWPYLERLNNY